jgi:hypothetical protein
LEIGRGGQVGKRSRTGGKAELRVDGWGKQGRVLNAAQPPICPLHAERSGGLEGLDWRTYVRCGPVHVRFSRGGMGPHVIGVRWLGRL